MTEALGREETKRTMLKELIRQLHAGAKPEELKERFKDALAGLTPPEIAQMEEELIQEGVPREKIELLCGLHLEVFREALEKEKPLAPAGHPVQILMAEHSLLLENAGRLQRAAEELTGQRHPEEATWGQIKAAAEIFRRSESHYLREENVLFPYLEKRGITQPPAIMWSEHNRIRDLKKEFYHCLQEAEEDFLAWKDRIHQLAATLSQMLSEHFYKENSILFPTSLRVIASEEWPQIRHQFDELGYGLLEPAPFAPVPSQVGAPPQSQTPPATPPRAAEEPAAERGEKIRLETGDFTLAELEAVLNSLPVDITFVDTQNTVRYFNQPRERIFARAKAVLGRRVERCHPEKSLHVVQQIIDDFRQGKRDMAQFWLRLQGRLILIRYFPVRDRLGNYLGVLEASQDITEIQKLTGEKRLLD